MLKWMLSLPFFVMASCGCMRFNMGSDTADRAFRAEVSTVGDCISSINTVVMDLDIVDRRGWYRRKEMIFRTGVVRDVRVKWIDDRHLEVTYVTGVVPERIYRQMHSWNSVQVSYRRL